MSGSQTQPGTSPGTGVTAGASVPATDSDPSMEDILASIRRILSEDEAAPAGGGDRPVPPAAPPARDASRDGVLVLDPAMMVPEAPTPTEVAEPAPPLAPHRSAATAPETPSASGLVAPEAVAAAASSVGSLMRTLAAERSMQVHSGGPTIEDIVREELPPC